MRKISRKGFVSPLPCAIDDPTTIEVSIPIIPAITLSVAAAVTALFAASVLSNFNERSTPSVNAKAVAVKTAPRMIASSKLHPKNVENVNAPTHGPIAAMIAIRILWATALKKCTTLPWGNSAVKRRKMIAIPAMISTAPTGSTIPSVLKATPAIRKKSDRGISVCSFSVKAITINPTRIKMRRSNVNIR